MASATQTIRSVIGAVLRSSILYAEFKTADVDAVNEGDFTALHGAAFRGLNEVIQILVDRGADINARDYRGRTPFRIAEGSKQSFQFQAYADTAAFIKSLGANTRLGVAGTVQERMRDIPAIGQPQQ